MQERVEAAERLGVLVHRADHLLEHVADRDRAGSSDVDEGAAHAVALRAPLVLDHDRALDRAEVPVAPRVARELARDDPVERRDGERIVDPRARIVRAARASDA